MFSSFLDETPLPLAPRLLPSFKWIFSERFFFADDGWLTSKRRAVDVTEFRTYCNCPNHYQNVADHSFVCRCVYVYTEACECTPWRASDNVVVNSSIRLAEDVRVWVLSGSSVFICLANDIFSLSLTTVKRISNGFCKNLCSRFSPFLFLNSPILSDRSSSASSSFP